MGMRKTPTPVDAEVIDLRVNLEEENSRLRQSNAQLVTQIELLTRQLQSAERQLREERRLLASAQYQAELFATEANLLRENTQDTAPEPD